MAPDDPSLPPDLPGGEAFADSPLFRELQRVLQAGAGPVNWELARQLAVAMASPGGVDPDPTEDDRRSLENTVRAAELQVAELTAMPAPSEVAPVEPMRRSRWVETTIASLKDLVEPAAARVGELFSRAQQEEQLPPDAAQFAGAMMGQVAPLLVGVQVGTVLGYLGQRVLGQYDVAIPHPGPGVVRFVVPNIAAFESEWSLPSIEFRAWVALHEVTHRFQFSRPWVRGHFVELLRDYVSTLEFDLRALQEGIERVNVQDPAALQELFQSNEGFLGPVLDDEQRIKLARIQAFMAAAEGHGEHVSERIGSRVLRAHSQIEEAVRRNREGESGDPVFERLLGVELKREQYRLGREFCERVVELTDEATLSRMWESAEALPSMPELEEPRLWLARVA